jgi:hypothetical protein
MAASDHGRGGEVRLVPKDRIRFAVPAEGAAPASVEVRIAPGRFGGWEATLLIQQQGDPAPVPVGRVFRARDRRLAADKMVAWVRGRYRDARPLAGRTARSPGA